MGSHHARNMSRTQDKGLVLRRYRTKACKRCPVKHQCTSTKERLISRWEHEHVLEAVQRRLDKNPQAMRLRRETVEHPFATLKMRMGANPPAAAPSCWQQPMRAAADAPPSRPQPVAQVERRAAGLPPLSRARGIAATKVNGVLSIFVCVTRRRPVRRQLESRRRRIGFAYDLD